jgi:predicted HicB family RNase H-like nuclease
MSEDKRLIGARVDEAFAERVEAAAQREERTISQFVRRALTAALESSKTGKTTTGVAA